MTASAATGGRLGFLDGFLAVFRRAPEAQAPAEPSGPKPEEVQQEFELALQGLTQKIEERRKEAAATAAKGMTVKQSAEERAAERDRRMEAAHALIRQDVDAMHERLGTEMGHQDLTELKVFLEELDDLAAAGKDSHELLPRVRYGIAKKLGRECGELALARFRELLSSAEIAWPDPISRHPSASAEDIERAQTRRLNEMREQYLSRGLLKSSERMVGVVGAWGSNYPKRDTPLWEETVLEAIAEGLRATLMKEFVERLRADKGVLQTRVQELIGPQLAELQKALQDGVTSIEDATQAVSAAMQVIDDVIPELAWQHLQDCLPHARGEWGG